jgi:hypothetical protein
MSHQHDQTRRVQLRTLALPVAVCWITTSAWTQSFNSGSTGADGDLIISSPGVTVFSQTPQGGGIIYNFRSITVASGSTLQISGSSFTSPVYFLAQTAVTINGTIDLRGGNGQRYDSQPALRIPSVPGPGGFGGGIGAFGSSPAQPGNGPAGGATNFIDNGVCFPPPTVGRGGGFTGNQFLVPLIGGSGGAGNGSAAGGAGGGAILIASSASISVNGLINVNGGAGNQAYVSGSGAAGAVRLVANAIGGNGSITATGGSTNFGCAPSANGGNGIVRMEAFQNTFTGTTSGQSFVATPFNLFLPTGGPPFVQVVSIGGVPVNSSPTGSFTVPDVTVNSSAALPVAIQAQNIPLGTTVTLFIFSENGPDQTIISTGLGGTLASSSATASVTLPAGFSRGFVKATWMQ